MTGKSVRLPRVGRVTEIPKNRIRGRWMYGASKGARDWDCEGILVRCWRFQDDEESDDC
jgi:hypothetical protein